MLSLFFQSEAANMKYIALLLLLSGMRLCYADSNVTQLENQGSFEKNWDFFHGYWSNKVVAFSSRVDYIGSNLFDDNDTDDEKADIALPFDSFFKEDLYLNCTNNSYIKLQGGYEYNHLGKTAAIQNITARLRLPRTQKRLHLFINEEPQPQTILPNVAQTSSDVGVGLKYYLPSMYDRLFSNISIGLAGIANPYAKTYFEYLIVFTDWQIKSTQNFKYSHRNKFDEWTDFYFDRQLSHHKMVRLLLQRSTNSEINGMEYLSQLSYIQAFDHKKSCIYYIGMNGRTQDILAAPYENGSIPQEGIYNYSTGIIWRQQLFKNYLFYQVEPILSYHEQYNYKPNYMLRFTVDLFFETKR